MPDRTMTPPQRRASDRGEEPTLGELGRLIHALHEQVERRFIELDRRLGAYEDSHLRVDLYRAENIARDAQHTDHERRLSHIEGRNEWLTRTVGGLILAGVLGLLFAGSRVVGG